MPAYLLRVEAVNFGETIYDTDQLSVRRGGSLLLLRAVEALRGVSGDGSTLPGTPSLRNWKPVSTAASIGLFAFEAEGDQQAETVRSSVDQFLRTAKLEYDGDSGHRTISLAAATFVVDVVEMRPVGDNDGFAEALDQVHAKNRWRQLQQPTVVADRPETGGDLDHFCFLDRIRPARQFWKEVDGRKRYVSNVVLDRFQYGKDAKASFYDSELKALAESDRAEKPGTILFAEDIDGIAGRQTVFERKRAKRVGIPTNLLGKIAVIHLDGNSFRSLSRGRAEQGAEAFRRWSNALRKHHQKLLGSLLCRLEKDEAWWAVEEKVKRVRLETLLWGGDEIIWIVPAWKGWELVEWFFGEEAADGVKHEVDGEPVTYSAGVVFCHAKAPIQRICGVASKLLDAAKRVVKEAGAGEKTGRHALAFEVLESLDDVSGDFEAHRRQWLPNLLRPDSDRKLGPDRWLTLAPDKIGQQGGWKALRTLAHGDQLPMRQLHRLVKAWRTKDQNDFINEKVSRNQDTTEMEACLIRINAALDDSHRTALRTFREAFGSGLVWPEDEGIAAQGSELREGLAWLQLLQMLPYAGERTPTDRDEAGDDEAGVAVAASVT